MTLEQLVPSLDLCKELKENGYPQESHFYWTIPEGHAELAFIRFGNLPNIDDELLKAIGSLYFAAPTSSEIAERLPNNIYIRLGKDGCEITHFGRENGQNISFKKHQFLNAIAKMWLVLKKNGLLEESI